jgi:hypothetical protein
MRDRAPSLGLADHLRPVQMTGQGVGLLRRTEEPGRSSAPAPAAPRARSAHAHEVYEPALHISVRKLYPHGVAHVEAFEALD